MTQDLDRAALTDSLINPFPGLRPYDMADADLFFGRDDQLQDLLTRLRSSRFVAVVGSSGCGKSSLVRAGLLPIFQAGFLAKHAGSWRIAILRPGKHPIAHLAAALVQVGVSPDKELNPTLASDSASAILRGGSQGLAELFANAAWPADAKLLVVVDQFEELFRFADQRHSDAAQAEAASFVNLLLDAASQSEVPIYIVLTLRSEFLGGCTEFAGLPEAINNGLYLVPRLSRDQLRDVIEGPIQQSGHEIESRLVDQLLEDVGRDPDQLPILQHGLMQLWSQWSNEKTLGPIDLENYEKIGRLQDALNRHLEEIYNEAPAEKAVVESLFRELTQLTEDGQEVRRPRTFAELEAGTGFGAPQLRAVIDRFRREGRSFLTPPADEPIVSRTMIDISHESLIRQWPRLREWVRDEDRSRRVESTLNHATAEWEKSQRRDNHLEGVQLAEALAWKERHPRQVTPAEQEFLADSLARRDSKMRRTLTFVSLLAGVAVVAAAVAFYERQMAYRGEMRAAKTVEALDSVNALLVAALGAAEAEKRTAESATEKAVLHESSATKEKANAERLLDGLFRVSGEISREGNDYSKEHPEFLDVLARLTSFQTDVLQKLLDTDPDNILVLQFQATQVAQSADLTQRQLRMRGQSRTDESRKQVRQICQQVREMAERLKDRSDFASQRSAILGMGIIASTLKNNEDLDEAPDACSYSLDVAARVEGDGKSDGLYWTSIVHQVRGEVLLARAKQASGAREKQADRQSAIEDYRRSVECAEQAIAIRKEPKYENQPGYVWTALGGLYLEMNDLAQALAAYESANKIWRSLPDQNQAVDQNLATSIANIGNVEKKLNHLEQARTAYDEYVNVRRKSAGPISVVTAAPGVKGNGEGLSRLGVALMIRGDLEREIGDKSKADPYYEQSKQIAERLVKSKPSSALYHQRLASISNSIGLLKENLDQWDEARKNHQHSKDEIERAQDLDPANDSIKSDWADYLDKLGNAWAKQRNFDQARACLAKSLQVYEELAQADPKSPPAQRNVAYVCNRLGDACFKQYEQNKNVLLRDEARTVYERSRGIADQLLKADPHALETMQRARYAIRGLGKVYLDEGKIEDARRCFSDLLDLLKRISQDQLPKNREFIDLTWYELLNGHAKETIATAEEGRLFLPDDVMLECNLAHGLLLDGQIAKAKELYLKFKEKDYEGRLLPEFIQEDFAVFRKLKLVNEEQERSMREIETLLGLKVM